MKCDKCGDPLRPVVALDLDGTLADYHLHFFEFAAQWLGDGAANFASWYRYDGSMDLSDWMGIDDRLYREIKLAYRQGGQKRSMPPMPGVHALNEALQRKGVEVWITTTRPYLRLDNIDPDTREWLRRNGVQYDHLIYDEHKYDVLAERVGTERVVLVLEDLLSQCEDAEQAGLVAWQPETKWNRAIQHKRTVSSLYVAAHVAEAMIDTWRQQWQ